MEVNLNLKVKVQRSNYTIEVKVHESDNTVQVPSDSLNQFSSRLKVQRSGKIGHHTGSPTHNLAQTKPAIYMYISKAIYIHIQKCFTPSHAPHTLFSAAFSLISVAKSRNFLESAVL